MQLQKKDKVDLKQVTLLCFENRYPHLAEWAINRCQVYVDFNKIVLITNLELVKNPKSEIEYIKAPKVDSIEDYSRWMMTELVQYVSGSHVLVIQWDSFIIHPELWNPNFLEYDYIGAVWPHHPQSPVGNGGFSLRSSRLLQALKNSDIRVGHPEDYFICAENKVVLEKNYHIRFAPVEIAELFAVERNKWHPAFGFHGIFNFANVLTQKELIDFLELVPKKMLNNLDAYDLLKDLENKKWKIPAQIIRKKLTFKWKYKSKYFFEKFKLNK